MPSPKASLRRLIVVAALLAVSACQSRPTTEAVSEFSQTLKNTSTSVQLGLDEIQRLEAAASDAAAAERILREADPNIQLDRAGTITDAVIAPRRDFFEALSKYASSLGAAVSDDQVDKVRAQFAATGQAFTDLGGRVAAASESRFPADLAAVVAKAASNLAAYMVEAKLNREVPKIVAATHRDLKAGVDAFKADLGDRKTGGFRAILHDLVEKQIGQEKKLILILKADQRTSQAVLHRAILDAQARVRQLRRSERMLDRIPAALDELLSAHEALLRPKEQSTLAKIQAFALRAKELRWAVDGLRL